MILILKKNGELRFIQELTKESVPRFIFFDIGANSGEYTDLIIKYLPTKEYNLHLFEPQKSCFDSLTKKFADNQNININNFGLSQKTESTTIFKDEDQSGFASLYKRNMDFYNISLDKTEAINLKNGREYITDKNIPKINFIKIDIEGHELEAFTGFSDFLKPDNIDYIQFEYGGANLDSHTSLLEIHELLTNRGFILCKMLKNSLRIQPYHPRLENFMYQNWVAVSPAKLPI